MCGIVGIASVAPVEYRDWLVSGRDTLRHRGPDDAGVWWSPDGRVGFGHRRLAIVDLSAAGHQPMHDNSGELTIVFNGEIYNFKELGEFLEAEGYIFHSRSDTEVILAAYRRWGRDCVAHLNGMFAFALLDARAGVVLIARDRAGEKPMFLHRTAKQLRFSSELKALLADAALDRRVDRESLDHYLAYGFVPGDRCILEGFAKLKPAHAMTFCIATGRTEEWSYWSPPAPPQALDDRADAFDGMAEQLVSELEWLLQDAVERQLVADVPVGVLLSGGTDSSLITAMAARVTNRVKTFTISFPGHGALDESEHARKIATHFGTDHTELQASPLTADLLPRLACQFDEPMTDSSIFPTFLVTQLARQYCTVALGGDGGDELFGGYRGHSVVQRNRQFARFIPMAARQLAADAAERLLPVGYKGRRWLQAFGADFNRAVPLTAPLFDARTRKRLMSRLDCWNPIAEADLHRAVPSGLDLLQRVTRLDFLRYLPEDILVKVDRASMLNSLEVRAPFLDYRIIDFAFGKVPSQIKANISEKKILPRMLAKKILPPSFDATRKQGFSIPLASWLKEGPFRELFWSVLSETGSYFDRRIVEGLLEGQDKGRSNSERLFSLVQLELWRQAYGATL